MENSEQNTQPTQIDTNENHFRHFVINDPNK